MKAKALLDTHPGEQACSQVLKSRRINSAARGNPDVQISCLATRVIYGWYENYGALRTDFTASFCQAGATALSAALSVCVSESPRSDSNNSWCFSRDVTSTRKQA